VDLYPFFKNLYPMLPSPPLSSPLFPSIPAG
jgi:hypothetical protein